jgi:hypothetical protein
MPVLRNIRMTPEAIQKGFSMLSVQRVGRIAQRRTVSAACPKSSGGYKSKQGGPVTSLSH